MPQIEISASAFDFLKKRAKPLEDTSITVLDGLIAEYISLKDGVPHQSTSGIFLNAQDAPSMRFTTVIEAEVNGRPASQNYWNNILEDVVRVCAESGGTKESIKKVMTGNIKDGPYHENGFRFVPAAGLSFQGLEANRAYKNIATLAKNFQIQLAIAVKWPNREDAAMPNTTARIVYP